MIDKKQITDYLLDKEPEVIETHKYIYDSSMVNNSILQNYLTILYGNKIEEDKISDLTIENLFRQGIYNKIQSQNKKNTIVFNEKYSFDLNDSWRIEAWFDMIDVSKDDVRVYENKLSYQYTLDKFKEDISKSNIRAEISIKKYIARKAFNVKSLPPIIRFFIKDKKNTSDEPLLEEFKISTQLNTSIKEKLYKKTRELQDYIENGIIPDICNDLWYKNEIPVKCSHYCVHGKNNNCPYYDNETKTIKKLKD